MEQIKRIAMGEMAPDFDLKDQDGKLHTLKEMSGRRVLLSLHPLAWTAVCAKQMQSLEAQFERFAALGAEPFGLSIDTTFSKHAWAKSLGIEKVRLLSDFWPHGALAKALGLFREKEGSSERANVLLDEDGRALWVKVYPISELPDLEEILARLSPISPLR
ncbi:MAG: redoxin domain-containing protein [bacterium]